MKRFKCPNCSEHCTQMFKDEGKHKIFYCFGCRSYFSINYADGNIPYISGENCPYCDEAEFEFADIRPREIVIMCKKCGSMFCLSKERNFKHDYVEIYALLYFFQQNFSRALICKIYGITLNDLEIYSYLLKTYKDIWHHRPELAVGHIRYMATAWRLASAYFANDELDFTGMLCEALGIKQEKYMEIQEYLANQTKDAANGGK